MTTTLKSVLAAVALSLVGGAALAADDCCCKDKKLSCCDKQSAQPNAPAAPQHEH
ncbi:MAG: hypothetical protein Q7T23_17365 [Phenylobacterium sp.]|nr:hypothetical protein [Phenylobacterium sp.]